MWWRLLVVVMSSTEGVGAHMGWTAMSRMAPRRASAGMVVSSSRWAPMSRLGNTAVVEWFFCLGAASSDVVPAFVQESAEDEASIGAVASLKLAVRY